MTADTAGIIERLRDATGADRELDADIWVTAVGRAWCDTMRRWERVERAWPVQNGGRWCFWFETEESTRGTDLIPYTASLDAALTLVPPDLTWALASREPQDMAPTPWAIIGDRTRALGEATGATPAIALCIAALLARQAAEAGK